MPNLEYSVNEYGIPIDEHGNDSGKGSQLRIKFYFEEEISRLELANTTSERIKREIKNKINLEHNKNSKFKCFLDNYLYSTEGLKRKDFNSKFSANYEDTTPKERMVNIHSSDSALLISISSKQILPQKELLDHEELLCRLISYKE